MTPETYEPTMMVNTGLTVPVAVIVRVTAPCVTALVVYLTATGRCANPHTATAAISATDATATSFHPTPSHRCLGSSSRSAARATFDAILSGDNIVSLPQHHRSLENAGT